MKKLLVKCETELPQYVSCNLPQSKSTPDETRKLRLRSQDSAYSWLVCLSAALSVVIMLGLPYSYGVLFPVLLDYFGESKAKTAWVGSLNMSLSFFMAPVAAVLCNRYGCRATTICGALVTVLGLLVTSQAPSILVMYLTYGVICTFGVSCVYTACFVIVPRYFLKRRSLATSVITVGPSVGMLSFGPLLQTLIDWIGWRNAFIVLAGITSIVCVLASSFDPNVEEEHTQTEKKVLCESPQKCERQTSGQWELLKNRIFVIYCAFSVVVFFGLYNPSIHIVQFAIERGIASDKASMLFFYYGLISTFARISSGILLDYKCVNATILCIIATSVNGISVVFLAWARTFSDILSIFLVLGLTEGALGCTMNILILNSVKPRQRALAYGLWLCYLAVPIAVGPPVSGLIADKCQSYSKVFIISGGIILGSVLILVSSFLPCVRTDSESTKQEIHIPVWEEFYVTERESVV